MSKGHRSRGGNRSGRGGKRVYDSHTSGSGVNYTNASKTTCVTGKWAWPLTDEGKAHAGTLLKILKKQGGKGIRVYECPTCRRWHVGHMPYETRRGLRSAREVYDGREGAA